MRFGIGIHMVLGFSHLSGTCRMDSQVNFDLFNLYEDFFMKKYIVSVSFEVNFDVIIESDSRTDADDQAKSLELHEFITWNQGNVERINSWNMTDNLGNDPSEFLITKKQSLKHLDIIN